MIGTVLATILAAALRTTGFVALVIRRANANAFSWSGRRLPGRFTCRLPRWFACGLPGRLACRLPRRFACRCPGLRIGRLNVKRVTSCPLIGCSPCNISASLVVCVHAVKAFIVLTTQSIFFVKTVAGSLVTIVFESNKLLWIRTFGAGASLCFSSAVTFDTKGGATTSIGCDGRIDSLDSSPFILLFLLINTDGVVLHTTKDVVVTFVVDPRNRAGEALLQR